MTPSSDDAYGRLLWARERGEAVYEIIERDDGFITASDMAARYFDAFDAWPAHERKAASCARGRVLDVGCGAGRHALHFQAQGHAVTAIDTSPLLVRLCRRRGVADVRCRSVLDDLAPLAPPEPFGTVSMLGVGFGLLGSADAARTVLGRLDALTTLHARVLAGAIDPHVDPRPCDRRYHARNTAAGRLPGQMRVRVRFEDAAGPWFDLLYLSPAEMETVLDGTPWRIARHFPGEGGAYIALLEKRI